MREGQPNRRAVAVSNSITLDLPTEFLELCRQDNVLPETVLRGFIADLCAIERGAAGPRADRYRSNGSNERLAARSYYTCVGYPYLWSY
jgi:hypothetical protein